MKEYLLLEKPTIMKKGTKVLNIVLVTNKGDILYTNWNSAKDLGEFKQTLKEIEILNKKIDK